MDPRGVKIAYFCAEHGHDGHILNGGLGILAADLLKSAADLGLPFVGVGLYYKMGNYHQQLTADGWQHETYRPVFQNGLMDMPAAQINVPMKWGDITLDSLIYTVNSSVRGHGKPAHLVYLNDQDNMDVLYPGDDLKVKRLIQEMELGIGGVRMLDALGFDKIQVYHSNEGHAALLTFALREKYGSYEEAKKHMVFTTHTPVPAGIDIYSKEVAEQVIPPSMLPEIYRASGGSYLHMMKLAMASSHKSFAVSRLHQQVSQNIFCDFPNMEQLTYIDNGIHIPTWASPEVARLYDNVTNNEWRLNPKVLEEKLLDVPEDRILGSREFARERLCRFINGDRRAIKNTDFNLDRLTIGFARRFATYKQATLIFEDIDRLRDLGKDIQLVFAGKAHPGDYPGKHVIKEIFRYMREYKDIPICFIEDYDIRIARYMVQGVDLWLNTPERLREAAGTSGMKAAANFVPQLSIIDGWWNPQNPPPGYRLPKGLVIGPRGEQGITGWGIGRLPTEMDFLLLSDNERARAVRARDRISDSANAIDTLKYDILPLWNPNKSFHNKTEWARIGSNAAAYNVSWFNSHRMALQYMELDGIPFKQFVQN